MVMRPLIPIVASAILASGCTYYRMLFPEDEPPPNCDTRLPYYPDQDGDGIGAASPVYVGCEAPGGYVELTGDCDDEDPSVIECPDTAPPEDTDDDDTGDDSDTDVPTGQDR